MQPYVIKQGDYLAALAYQFGFDADTVWNDPKNAQLQQLRPNQNILFAGDVLYIPDQVDKPPEAQSLTPGSTNTFVTSPPTTSVSVKFRDPALGSQSFTVLELPQLTGLTTGGDGTASFDVPVTQAIVTVVFMSDGTTFVCNVGHLDPIATLSGVFQRLQHLGYLSSIATLDETDIDDIRAALRAFKADQAPVSESPPSSSPFIGPSTGSSTAPPSSGNGVASPSGPASTPQGASPSSPASLDSTPPPSAPDSGQPDNAGLADDGTLDDATSQLLLAAHGV